MTDVVLGSFCLGILLGVAAMVLWQQFADDAFRTGGPDEGGPR